jgi:UDP-2,3-diacylglucosamine hydrolase
MQCNHNDGAARALFVADSHFRVRRDAAEQHRFERFVDLLDRFAGIGEVILLGDIFDFWFDYPHFQMKGFEPLLAALDRVREAGSRIHFVGGNHDIWAAGYLHRRLGTEPAAGPLTLMFDGCRVHCLHGDGLLGRDLFYRGFRQLVRHPAGVWLAKSLHPELLFSLSTWLSGTSRQCSRDEVAEIERKVARWLAAQRNPAWDLLIVGHIHHRYTATCGGRSLICLGGWLDDLNYGLWRDGRFEHCRFATTDGEPELLRKDSS